MNSEKLKESIDIFKNYLGDALISSNVWDKKNGLTIASYKSNERYAALFARIIKNMEVALDDLDFPPFGEYQLIDLEADYLLLLINFKHKYVWGSLIDKTKVSLGELIYIAKYKAKTAFKEAMV